MQRTGSSLPAPRFLAILAATLLALPALPPAVAAEAGGLPVPEGLLAAVAWERPDAAMLAPFDKEVWLLTQNAEFALLALPTGAEAAYAGVEGFAPLEPLAATGGDYYVVYLEDAGRAQFTGGARVLFRGEHAVLVWSPGPPRLTPASRAQLHGLIQPQRISLTPKPRPARDAGPDQGALAPPPPGARASGQVGAPSPEATATRTDFHPLIAQMVADVEQAEYVAKWQALDDFETRYYDTSQNEASSQYMYDLFATYGLQAEFHQYYQSGNRRNVIGTLPGLTQPERVVYITGHFDSISEDPQNHAPGADDNASGTTAFLEAARVLSNYQFEYTIKFVGFNGEEQGLVGSGAYVDDIAAAGEDVVGCYNFDMIAYAGVDPAPPDLVIYTNTASQPLAQIMHDACLEYVPNDVEPVINTSAIGASDHASFWDHGYPAVLAIEEEAWGDDFCPWYHTSDDRIERYPQDYPTHCTMAAVAAAAHSAVPLQPADPYLVIDGEAWDDDASGGSQGDGDGLLEYGETIEHILTLLNIGSTQASAVSGELLSGDPYISVLASTASFGTIDAAGTGSNAPPFVYAIDPQIPDGREVLFRVAVSESPDTLAFTHTVQAPDLQPVALTVDDAAGGDGDGIPEPGEELLLTVAVGNEGSTAASSVAGVLSSASIYLTIDPAPVSYGSIEPGASSAPAGVAVTIEPNCPEIYSAMLSLELTDGAGYDRTESLAFYIGDVFAENVEAGAGAWSHTNGSAGYIDEWHLETYRNHTVDGTTSWKCGGAGSADYGNLLHAVLESPVFTLPPDAEIRFWHWIDAEVSGSYPDACYDGGLVEISIDGAPWERLTPAGGYPYVVRTGGTPGPFPADTPVWSGSHDWQEEVVDLSGYSGSARLRFIFGSDGAVSAEGWYLDDLQLHFSPSGLGAEGAVRALTLHPARPNPATSTARLTLDLPRSGRVAVQVLDVSGRLVRGLYEGRLPAGRHQITWDGRDGERRPVAAGVYWLQAQTGPDRAARTRLVIVR